MDAANGIGKHAQNQNYQQQVFSGFLLQQVHQPRICGRHLRIHGDIFCQAHPEEADLP